MVGKKCLELRRSACLLEKKKLAASVPSAAQVSATLCEMADFPNPAGPLTQHTRRLSFPRIHPISAARTSSRVPGRHLGAGSRSLELNAAPDELAFLKTSESATMMAYEFDPDANSANLFTRSYDLIDLIAMYCGIIL
jgi:hypothetical protein